MTWPWWTETHWGRLVALCQEDGVALSEDEVREAAEGYMDRGSEGGGNQWGLQGTVVALNVDKVARARHDERAM